MNYLIYSVLPEFTNGQFDIVKLVDTEANGKIAINNSINNIANTQQDIIAENLDDIKSKPDGLYVIWDNNKATVYNKKTNKKQTGWIRNILVDEISVTQHMTFHIKEIPKEELVEYLNKSIIEDFKQIPEFFGCYHMENNKFCFGISEEGIGYCEKHKPKCPNSMEASSHKCGVILTVKELLDRIEYQGREKKIHTILTMYNFLALNRYIVTDSFKKTVIEKLEQFDGEFTAEEKQLMDPQKYLNFFNNPIDLAFVKSIEVETLEKNINLFR